MGGSDRLVVRELKMGPGRSGAVGDMQLDGARSRWMDCGRVQRTRCVAGGESRSPESAVATLAVTFVYSRCTPGLVVAAVNCIQHELARKGSGKTRVEAEEDEAKAAGGSQVAVASCRRSFCSCRPRPLQSVTFKL